MEGLGHRRRFQGDPRFICILGPHFLISGGVVGRPPLRSCWMQALADSLRLVTLPAWRDARRGGGGKFRDERTTVDERRRK